MTGWNSAHYTRVALPAAGGLGDQDALQLETLEYVRGVMTAILHEQLERRRRDDELAKWRAERKVEK